MPASVLGVFGSSLSPYMPWSMGKHSHSIWFLKLECRIKRTGAFLARNIRVEGGAYPIFQQSSSQTKLSLNRSVNLVHWGPKNTARLIQVFLQYKKNDSASSSYLNIRKSQSPQSNYHAHPEMSSSPPFPSLWLKSKSHSGTAEVVVAPDQVRTGQSINTLESTLASTPAQYLTNRSTIAY